MPASTSSPAPKPPTLASPSRRVARLTAGLIFVTALVAYWNSFHGPLVMDDKPAILDNATIRHLWPLSHVLLPPAYSGPSGRPVLNLSFALNYAVGGSQIFGYHVVNFALHVLVGLVVFGVVRRTLLSPRLRERFAPSADYLSAAIALLWTVHPVGTAAVTYISQRAEVLMALFYLLTLYCFLRGTTASPASRRWYGLSILCCWLGMATKEVMVTAPFVVFVYDSIFVAKSVRDAWRSRRGFYAGLAASWLFLATLMLAISKRSVGFGQGVSVWHYLLTECQAVVHYVKIALWPQPLVFDFGPVFVTDPLTVLPSAAVLLLLLVGTIVALRRSPALGFIGLWFFVILSPSSSVVPVALQPIAESRLYLPLVALVAGVVLGLHRWLGKNAVSLLLVAAAGAIITTSIRNEDYRDEPTLWKDTLAKQPRNSRAHGNLGIALDEAGQTDEAIQHYRKAIELDPSLGRVHFHLARALFDKGRVEEAIHEYGEAWRLERSYADAQVNTGATLAEAGRSSKERALLERSLQLKQRSDDVGSRYQLGLYLFQSGQTEAAVREFRRLLELNPNNVEAGDALGFALFRLGRPDDAIRQYEQVLRVKPDFAVAHHNFGNVLFSVGRPAEAAEHFKRAVQLNPEYAPARTGLGMVALQLGQIDDARANFEAALRLDPNDAEAHFRLGNIMAMAGRMSDAAVHWRETLRLRPDDAEAHNNLAIALTQAGRIPEAIQHYEEALRLKPDYERARNNLLELRARQNSTGGK